MYSKITKPSLPVLNPTHPLAKGMLAAWLMVEGGGSVLRDYSGRRYDATINGTGVTWGFHVPGRVLDMAGASGDYISINSPASFNIATATTERTAFIVYKTAAVNASLFGMRNSGDADSIFDFQLGGDGVDNAGTGRLSFIVRASNASGLTHIHDTVATNDGVWHSAAAWMNSAKAVRIYRDGIVVASGTHAMTATTTFDNVRIGDEPSNAAIPNMIGSIALAIIYDRALADQEILQLHKDPYTAFRQPFKLSIPPPAGSTVQLSWTDNSSGGQTFSIERSVTSAYAGFAEIATGEAGPTYDDSGLADDTYWYRVRGTADGGTTYSDYTNVVEVTTST